MSESTGPAIELAKRLADECQMRPRLALVLGSGLSGLAERISVRRSYSFAELPGFRVPTAIGHPGNLIMGTLHDVPLVALQGRLHLYEGHNLSDVIFPIRVMQALGASHLLLSNAAGGVNPHFQVGDLMVLRDHVNLLFRTDWPFLAGSDRPAFRQRSEIYSPQFRLHLQSQARAQDVRLHEGVYAALSGPNYETRAEYRMLRRWGVDAVGMSTVPEAIAGAELGMSVAAISVITNACSPDQLGSTSGAAVVQAARGVEHQVLALVEAVLAG